METPETILINLLKEKGVEFAEGLTEAEFQELEQRFGLQFPPDLKRFLQAGLPISDQFPPWREALGIEDGEEWLDGWLAWVLEGMLFDVEHNNFWYRTWGPKPGDLEAQFEIARKHYATYPQLIPVYGHRFIPSAPQEEGNPIFSVWQMDIIYYGYSLAQYLATEFKFHLPESFPNPGAPQREIEFWTECCDGSVFNDPPWYSFEEEE